MDADPHTQTPPELPILWERQLAVQQLLAGRPSAWRTQKNVSNAASVGASKTMHCKMDAKYPTAFSCRYWLEREEKKTAFTGNQSRGCLKWEISGLETVRRAEVYCWHLLPGIWVFRHFLKKNHETPTKQLSIISDRNRLNAPREQIIRYSALGEHLYLLGIQKKGLMDY